MDIAVKNAKSSDELQEKYTDWTFGELPEIMEIHRKGASLIGHPAVVDNDTFCTIEVFDDPEQAMRVNRDGHSPIGSISTEGTNSFSRKEFEYVADHSDTRFGNSFFRYQL